MQKSLIAFLTLIASCSICASEIKQLQQSNDPGERPKFLFSYQQVLKTPFSIDKLPLKEFRLSGLRGSELLTFRLSSVKNYQKSQTFIYETRNGTELTLTRVGQAAIGALVSHSGERYQANIINGTAYFVPESEVFKRTAPTSNDVILPSKQEARREVR